MKPVISRVVVLAAVCLVLLTTMSHAQSSLGIGTAEPMIRPNGFGGPFLGWINQQQQAFYRALTGTLKAMRSDPWQMWGLVSLSFLYGIFHAAGPGHGKAVISSYMIANEVALKRGVVLAFLSSMLQAVTAVALVGFAYYVLRSFAISMTEATHFMEITSYALIAAFGFWLLSRKLLSLRSKQPVAVSAAGHQHAHADHHQGHDHGHHHHHHSDSDACSTCGHSHLPDPALISGRDFSLREAWGAVVAVGLRPCTGALIVLTFSMLNGLWLAGIVSTFAMALGTAITVSALATLAVMAKGAAVRLSGASMGGHVGTLIEILGAAIVLALGLLLLAASLQA
ncbi:nickel/cobalt transporter [Hoeflea sp. YIM 152468]|uniref:nickel/cobalt transporter n=1 Tax=Hoeflea sp. YIM 152468 TaxID=3031759 RepID=UPI0023DCE979|nr:nickel/cobalt transporter [Hoeflea sp. YIM 152468]MDF1609206.1 nickel/cobalt transporter [Hoeflea sp. YIM 152468]